MEPRLDVLFIVNGMGLGNSTRCHALIEVLHSMDFQIDLLTSGNGLHFFSQNRKINRMFSLRPLAFSHSQGRLNPLKTILNLPKILFTYLLNTLTVWNILRQGSYRAVVIDSDYTLLFLRILLKVPVIAINNSKTVVEEFAKCVSPPSGLRFHLLVEKLDFFFHQLIPDLVLVPCFDLHPAAKGKFLSIPPLARIEGIPQGSVKKVKKVLIMLSGSSLGEGKNRPFEKALLSIPGLTFHVLGKQGHPDNHLRYHGTCLNNISLLQEADIFIINAGLSSISEIVLLKKPSIVIPLANHAEQFINAQFIVENKLGLLASYHDIHEKLCELLDRFEEFRSRHLEFQCAADGAVKAAGHISNELAEWEQYDRSSQISP